MGPTLPSMAVVAQTGSDRRDASVCAALRTLSRHVSRQMDRFLAGHGLTLTEFELLRVLRQFGPSRTVALAQRVRLDPGPTSRCLAALEARGLVTRTERWRFGAWAVSPSTATQLEVVEPLWHDVEASVREELGRDFVTALLHAVDRLPAWSRRQGSGWSDD